MKATKPTKRQTASSIRIDANVRCLRIYPVEDKASSTKSIAELKTVGVKVSREQAVHLLPVYYWPRLRSGMRSILRPGASINVSPTVRTT